MKKLILPIAGIVIVLCFFVLQFDILKENGIAHGTVAKVYEAGVKDVVFELEGDAMSYYINRGVENGFAIETLKKELTGREISLVYVKGGWTPLAPFGTTSKHILRLHDGSRLLYSESGK